MTTAWLSHPGCLLHDMGDYHPECPDRLTAIEDRVARDPALVAALRRETAPEATREQIERAHDARLVDAIERASPASGLRQIDPDTAMNPHTLQAIRHAAGAAVRATDLVASGEVDNAFCAVRPPGHHAEHARAMGFCIFNNVAIGALQALEAHGFERVAVVDFDVHHGNGTEDIFRDDPRVMMVSTFQHPLYPFSGEVPRSPNMVNVPLAPRTSGDALRAAVTERWLPALDTFRPDMVFISAGFDAHREDDMANLGWVESDYAWVTREVLGVAERHARGRIVSVLEGGYNLSALARSVAAHLKVLMGTD